MGIDCPRRINSRCIAGPSQDEICGRLRPVICLEWARLKKKIAAMQSVADKKIPDNPDIGMGA